MNTKIAVSVVVITKNEASHLNGQYTNFGIVTSGMDVVTKMQIGDKILGITVEK